MKKMFSLVLCTTKICEKRYYKSNLNFNFTTRIIDYFIFVRNTKYIIIRIQKMAPMKIHYPILLYSVDDVAIYEGGN